MKNVKITFHRHFRGYFEFYVELEGTVIEIYRSYQSAKLHAQILKESA